jgi:C4-type Zn-finger protein
VSWTPLLLVACSSLLLVACESTQDKSAKLAKQAVNLKHQSGLKVTKVSRDVKVRTTAVLNDPNGTAAVVTVRNTSKKTLVQVPIAIDVKGRKGKSVFANDDPGLEPSLVAVSVLRPGEQLSWVDDQVQATATPRRVKAKVGEERGRAPARLPRIQISPPKLEVDPTSGVLAVGKLTNESGVLQRNLVVYAVARKGGRIVAAGRGAVEKLKPHHKATYQVFFIGNPRGAQLSLAAPPTVLR